MNLDREQIETTAATGSFSGVVTVDVSDERVFELTRGVAHRAFGAPISADMQFGMASGSKAFTALAIMRLVEDGSLSLDQPVREILDDDLPLIDDRVTIEHLLEHTSGIGDYLDEEADWDVTDYVLTAPVHTLTSAESFLPLLEGLPQKSTLGQRFTYNNGGYVVLGIVIERVAGDKFQNATKRLVLDRAGLTQTGFLRLDDLPGSAAVGYLYAEGNRANTLHLPVHGSADGGGFTTASDMHKFWLSILTGQIVSPKAMELMTTSRHDNVEDGLGYGMGFFVHPTGRALVLMGYDVGQSFFTWHLPESETTISVLGNTSEGAWPIVGTIASRLAEELKVFR